MKETSLLDAGLALPDSQKSKFIKRWMMKKILKITKIFLIVMFGLLAIAVSAQGVTGQAGLASGLETTATGTLDSIGVAGLAIGVAETGSQGGVHVLHSTTSGPSAEGGQYWNQDHPEVEGVAEYNDLFGYAVVWGDFDGNMLPDLAIGTPQDHIGVAVGSVTVLYGTPAGISAAGSQYFQGEISEINLLDGDKFGYSLAAGDFNNDGYDDLVIGIPNDDIGEIEDAGGLHVLYGSPGGLDIASAQSFDQNSPNVYGYSEAGDNFGYSLAVGDFDGDDYDDLAVGVPYEDIGYSFHQDEGIINLLYGSENGLVGRDTYFNQDSYFSCCVAEDHDYFGKAFAAGDFNNDGYDDLAIGVPGEDIGENVYAGLVNLLYGSEDGLVDINAVFSQDMFPGCSSESDDWFGNPLAAGDLNGDGYDDLVIGVPGEDIGAISNAGGINVLYGEDSGLEVAGAQTFNQDSPGVYGTSENFDRFGLVLAVGDLNEDGYDDLAVSVPYKDFGTIADAGIVHILSGAEGGLWSNDQWITQEMTGLGEAEYEYNHRFGWSLAIWPLPFPYTSTEVCQDVAVSAGWNMVSVPVEALDMTLGTLFAEITPPAYRYNVSYQTVELVDTLENGVGYWMFFDAPHTYQICGEPVAVQDVPLSAGWNMIGGFEQAVSVDSITSTPEDILVPPVYGYSGSYQEALELSSGAGYWAFANQAGTLHLSQVTP